MSLSNTKNSSTSISTLAFAMFAMATPANADDSMLRDIIVTAPHADALMTQDITPESTHSSAPDGAAIAARATGAALTNNGALSGQLQYRGLFGERIAAAINGQSFASGGPNAMDPALHYAPTILIQQIEVARSISPVSDGPALGGAVNVVLMQPSFSNSKSFAPQLMAHANYRSSDNSYGIGTMTGISNENFRFGVLASYEKGENQRYKGGEIASSGHSRLVYGVLAGAQNDSADIALEYRRQETGKSGNPPFPMDIVYFNTDFLRLDYKGQLSDDLRLNVKAGHVAVRHLMDNFSYRTAPTDLSRTRATYAEADTMTARTSLLYGSGDNHLEIGADYMAVDKNVTITNPNNAAFVVKSLNNIESERFGGFAEIRFTKGSIGGELGVRFDHHTQSAGLPELGTALPMMPRTLANIFAATDRSWKADTWDASARFWLTDGAIRPRLVLATKQRAPGMVELFSWLPTEASGGLADGNIYLGNLNLKAERAWIAEAGFDYASGGFSFRPTIYYRRIDNYIQGTPFDSTIGVIDSPTEMVANMNGDATPLMFRNVDAEIWGFDADFSYRFTPSFRMDGVLNYARGKRRDINDNLYRIAPPNARLTVTYEGEGWYMFGETQLVAKQNKVSVTNSEQATKGYALLNAGGGVMLAKTVSLDVGVENIFDKQYEQHLAGYNRVMASDVGVGDRLPGAGRSAYVRLSVSY